VNQLLDLFAPVTTSCLRVQRVILYCVFETNHCNEDLLHIGPSNNYAGLMQQPDHKQQSNKQEDHEDQVNQISKKIIIYCMADSMNQIRKNTDWFCFTK
jgi:hypothetical protein